MTAVSPGDEVTVTITGTVSEVRKNGSIDVETASLFVYDWLTPDANVKVTVLRPDRPTRREVLEQHKPHVFDCAGDDRMPDWVAKCGYCGVVAGPSLFQAEALNQYAAHLDAVLTKWEEN